MEHRGYTEMLMVYEECIDHADFKQMCYDTVIAIRPYIINHIIDEIVGYCDGKTEILKWVSNDCPYDKSGELKHTHEFLTMDNTVNDVVGNYTGNSQATHISGCGLNFEQVFERLNELINRISYEVFRQIFRNHLEKSEVEINEDAFNDIVGESGCEIEFKIGNIELNFSEDEFAVEDILGLDASVTVGEFVKNKVDLPEYELWNEVLKTL